MPRPTAFALTGFITWTLLLLVLMEGIRSKLVLSKALPVMAEDLPAGARQAR